MQPPYGQRPQDPYGPPQQGYYPQQYPPHHPYHAAPQSSGIPALVWVGLAMALLVVFAVGGAALFFVMMRASAPVAVAPASHGGLATSGDDDTGDSDDSDDPQAMAPNLPPPHRDVPVHDVRLLDGCSTTDLKMVESRIDDAIDVGAPAYNSGDFLACYTAYDDAARELQKKLPSSCKGPRQALDDGRKKARTRTTTADQAWAMRDAFDGLLDVIERKGVDL